MLSFLGNLTRLCQSWRGRGDSPRSLPWQAGESVSQASAGNCNVYISLVLTRSITWSITWSPTKMYSTFMMFKAWERYVSAGRTCRLEKCGFNTKDHEEFEKHLAQHKEDLKKRLICNQVSLHPYACMPETPFSNLDSSDRTRTKPSRIEWWLGYNNPFRRVAELNLEIRRHGRSTWRRTK